MPDHFWIAILSSSLLLGILGAFIASAFGLHGKRDDCVNDYVKTIIKRRMEAYQQLEQLIDALKLASDSNP